MPLRNSNMTSFVFKNDKSTTRGKQQGDVNYPALDGYTSP